MTDMEITEVVIELVNSRDDGLLGFTNFCVNEDLKINGVAVRACVSSPTGIRLVFPHKEHNGQRFNSIYPINKAAYKVIAVSVGNAYLELIKKLR